MSDVLFTELPVVDTAMLSDIICAVQGNVSSQETLQKVFNLMLANTVLHFAGNPNGNVAGVVYQFCWDTSGSDLYVCSTTGTALTAVWSLVSSGSLALPVSMANGGTGKNNTADLGAIPYSTASQIALLAATNIANRPLMSGANDAPTWSEATYPNSTTINRILYSTDTDQVGELATANSATLITSAGGAPSLSQTLPTTVQGNITQLGAQSQALNMNTHLINSVVDPVSAQDAATKNYVDTLVAGFAVVFVARLASTTALTVTYNNGASGVGATLTNAGAQAALSLDGTATAVNDLVLIKNQASTLQNGYYVVTDIGSGASNWVLTRSVNYDQPSEINPGDIFVITSGATLANTSWIETATVTAVGTDPITFSQFSVALPITVPNGGTGVSSFTAYAPIFGGTTATGALQSGAVGTSGQVLTSNGAGAIATFQSLPTSGFTSIVVQVFAAGSSTYTPTPGMKYCITQIVGAGGSGGGVSGGNAGQASAAGGGAGGGYCRKTYSAANIGASAAVVVGAGGTGATSGANNGNAGGNSTFTPAGTGVTLTATGGGGGTAMAESASAQISAGGTSGSGTNGDINVDGARGGQGATQATGVLAISGTGGGTFFSPSSHLTPLTISGGGSSAIPVGYGGGSNGAFNIATSNQASNAGADGICIVTEFISS